MQPAPRGMVLVYLPNTSWIVGADAILTQGADFGCPISAICNFQENNRLLCMRVGQ